MIAGNPGLSGEPNQRQQALASISGSNRIWVKLMIAKIKLTRYVLLFIFSSSLGVEEVSKFVFLHCTESSPKELCVKKTLLVCVVFFFLITKSRTKSWL